MVETSMQLMTPLLEKLNGCNDVLQASETDGLTSADVSNTSTTMQVQIESNHDMLAIALMVRHNLDVVPTQSFVF